MLSYVTGKILEQISTLISPEEFKQLAGDIYELDEDDAKIIINHIGQLDAMAAAIAEGLPDILEHHGIDEPIILARLIAAKAVSTMVPRLHK